MESTIQSPVGSSVRVDDIPVLWLEPNGPHLKRRLVIFLPYLGGTKEQMMPYLEDIAAAGYIALSFDPWQHGERSAESQQERMVRVFGNFRRYMWPILGQTTLDTLRVIDWAVATLNVEPGISIAGISMGGDIAIAAAGLDHRIERVAAVVATPDWQRPGMHDISKPEMLLPQGQADAYAQYFYKHLNPLTHLAAYTHGPAIKFMCGEKDNHVPADGALRFRAALQEAYPSAVAQVFVDLIPGMGHLDVRNPSLWWADCLTWLTRV